ncbi:MAG: uroporphyrinogen decarboxylase family protein [Acidobacteriota bacterium]
MTSRERVLESLNHREPDRVPVDFGGTAVTGVHVSCIAALRDYYGLEKRPVKLHEPYQMLGWVDDDLKDAMGIDVEGVMPYSTMFGFPNENWKMWRTGWGQELLVPGNFNVTYDANGDTLIYPEGDTSVPPSGRMPKGFYFFDAIIRQEPIDDDNLKLEDNVEEFTPISEAYLAQLATAAPEAASKGRAVIAGFGGTAFGDIALVPAPFLKHPKGIRDITEWYISTTSRRDFVHRIFERQAEVAIANLEKIHAVVGRNVDVVFVCGTDFGTQTSSFCSVKTLRELYMPYYQRVNGWIHKNTSWKTFKHSCGAVEKFMESFIDSGFDIINPVQCSATGMDPALLKQKYGDRLVFWGGGVDTQKVLPFGTPAEVRRQVLERCETFAKGGGFVFDTIHNIQARTPVENIVAMVDAVREFNGERSKKTHA